jgi:hypothetical protein
MNMAIAAPAKAIHGETNKLPAKKAKIKPESDPSKVLPLLNGNRMPIKPPKIEAVLSPNANMAIAAAVLMEKGKISKVSKIPKA